MIKLPVCSHRDYRADSTIRAIYQVFLAKPDSEYDQGSQRVENWRQN